MAADDWGFGSNNGGWDSGGNNGDWDTWGEAEESIVPHADDPAEPLVPESAIDSGWGYKPGPAAPVQALPNNVYEGIVKDVNISPVAPRNRTFLGAVIRSVRYGVPFSMEDTRVFFNLQNTDSDGDISLTSLRNVGVTVFGGIEAGLLSNGQVLRVTGKRGPDNSIYATKLENLTNGTSVRFKAGLDGNIVRGIVLALGALLVVLAGYVLGGGVSMPHFDLGRIALYVIVFAVGIWLLVQSLRHPSPGTLKLAAIIVVVLICMLFPNIFYRAVVYIFAFFLLWICIKAIFK